MPTVRVDEEVYDWLQSLAKPFVDSPNSVLRHVAGLEAEDGGAEASTVEQGEHGKATESSAAPRRMTGKYLNSHWGVYAKHALYHQDGMFYQNLKSFPGALFDPHGFVLFQTEREYGTSLYLRIGQKLNVPTSIVSIPGYKRMG